MSPLRQPLPVGENKSGTGDLSLHTFLKGFNIYTKEIKYLSGK